MLDNTPFRYEVLEVIKKGKFSAQNFIETTITGGKTVVRPLTVIQMSRYRDYIENFAQLFTITIVTTLKEYEELILADASTLKMTVRLYEVSKNGSMSAQYYVNPIEFTYKAKIIDIASDQLAQNNPMINNTQMGNLAMKQFSLQLIEPGFESVSIRTVGGAFRNVAGIELMKTLLTRYSTDDEVDVVTAVQGVNVVAGYSEVKNEQIVLDHMTPLVKAINKIDENSGGTYPTGFSYFLQSNLWYIFPPYDLTLFNKATRTITVVNLPKDRLPTLEKTYFNSETKLIVLSTRDATYTDNREANTFNAGSSIRFMDANRLMDGFGEIKDNKFLVNASLNVNEVTLDTRKDGANILRPTQTRITSNKNSELSKLAKQRGFYFQLIWENSDDSLLFPGMPAKILFLKDNKPASATGTLIETETIWTPAEKNFKATKLTRTTAMTFFVCNEEYVSS